MLGAYQGVCNLQKGETMPRKGVPLSDEQKAKMAAGRAARKAANAKAQNKNPETNTTPPTTPPTQPTPVERASTELGVEQLTKMVLELQEQLKNTSALNEAFRQGQSTQPTQSQTKVRTLFSEDLSVYENPVPRLLEEPRLQRIAFQHNYDIEYKVTMTKAIDKKDGTMERQPQFNVELHGIISDDNGEPTGKRFIAKKMVFFEDPETAIDIAERQGLSMDSFPSEQDFLNKMRYIRIRDWLFGFFWKEPTDADKSDFRDEVIGGQVVRTFQKSTEADKSVKLDYDGLQGSKLR